MLARWEGKNWSEGLPNNFLPSMRLMRTIFFSLSGKLNLQLTATPTTDVTSKGSVLEPFVFDPSISALIGKDESLIPEQLPVPTGTLLNHSLHQSLVWPTPGARASALSPGASSPFPECCQALEGLHWVPVYGIRQKLLTNILVIENCDRLSFRDCCW